MTMLGHPSQTFVLTNYILWCNRTRKKNCGRVVRTTTRKTTVVLKPTLFFI